MSAWFDNKYKEESDTPNCIQRSYLFNWKQIFKQQIVYKWTNKVKLLLKDTTTTKYWIGGLFVFIGIFCFVFDSLNYYFNKRISRNFNFCFEVNTLCYHFHDSLIDHLIFFYWFLLVFVKLLSNNVNNKWHLY